MCFTNSGLLTAYNSDIGPLNYSNLNGYEIPYFVYGDAVPGINQRFAGGAFAWLMPPITQAVEHTTDVFLPSPTGWLWITPSQMASYTWFMTGKQLKYSTTRFGGDKFFIFADFTNQNMLDIPAGYDISGSLVWKSG